MVRQFRNYRTVAYGMAERFHKREMTRHEYKMYCRLYRTNEKLVPRILQPSSPFWLWAYEVTYHLFEIECHVKDCREPHPLPIAAYWPKSREYQEYWIQVVSDYNHTQEFKQLAKEIEHFGVDVEIPEWMQ